MRSGIAFGIIHALFPDFAEQHFGKAFLLHRQHFIQFLLLAFRKYTPDAESYSSDCPRKKSPLAACGTTAIDRCHTVENLLSGRKKT